MTEAEFRALAAQGYNRIPARARDVRGPRYAAVALRQARATSRTRSCSSRSSAASASAATRSSACRATMRIRARGTHDRSRRRRGAVVERHDGDPLAFVGAFLRRYRAAPRPGLPRFCGGLAGLVRLRHGAPHRDEARRHARRRAVRGSPEVPDILLLLTEELAVVDNLAGKISLIVYADPGEPDAYASARERLQAAAAQAARAGRRFRSRRRPDAHAGAKRVRRRRLPARGAARARNTSPPAT